MKPKAIIYGEKPHRELSIHEVSLWSFNDPDNVHEIENQKQMADEIVATRGSLNNHLIYLYDDYPGMINDASIEPVAKVSCIKYDEDTKTFIADIISTNQQFIEMIATTEHFPRVHPCYEAETNRRFIEGESTRVTSTFKRLLCWLTEPSKIKTKLSIEYHPEGKSDESNNNNDIDNEKTTLWETMRAGINTTLDSFCNKIISSSVTGGSYKKSGCLRQIFLRGKIIDIINGFDTDLDSWTIFIGDTEKPRILINTNGDITADISAFITDPLCMKDIQTLCDMLSVCRNNNWQVGEDTHEEQMESCEASDDKEDIANLIPKEELMKIIFENVKGILENDLSYHAYTWACQDNSWSLTSYEDSFRYVIYDRQRCTSKSIGCNFDKDHWEIYIDEASNVNIVVYPDEARWMTDALLFRTPNKDFPKDTLENIIEDINTWIKTKTMPNKEFEAFSQSLIKDGKRPSKIDYYLAMAEVASTRGTCLRRRFGAVIVKDDRIVSTGYVGAPSGRENCCDIGYCFREHHKIPSGTMYEKCRSTHAEMNAIINASKEEMEGATLYLVGVEPDGSYTNADCCAMCKRVIINSGIEYVVAKQKNGTHIVVPVKDWILYDDSLDIDHKGY
jgi:dCMP deaminase